MKYGEVVPTRNDSLCRESSGTGHKIQRKHPSVTTEQFIESTKVYDSQKIIDVNYMRNTFSLILRNGLKVSICLYNTVYITHFDKLSCYSGKENLELLGLIYDIMLRHC